MNIIETTIPDVTETNIPENKEMIADSIIENVYPLFDEVHQAKSLQVSSLKKQVKSGTLQMKQMKNTMQQLMTEYKKEKKIAKILKRVEKLIKSGLTYDRVLQQETVILLKIIDKLPENKLNHQLERTMRVLNKRFS